MTRRHVRVPGVLALLAFAIGVPANAAAQVRVSTAPATTPAPSDPAGLIEAVRQTLGGRIPHAVRITASGSGYATDRPGAPYFRIETYTMELDLASAAGSERLVRLDREDGREIRQTESRPLKADAADADQHLFWMTPLGFLAGASSRKATLAPQTLFGTPYRVLTFATPAGRVHGYVTDGNVLERIRADVPDRTGATTRLEAVFFQWTDFKGLKYPSIVIHKVNDHTSRVLVVTSIEATDESGSAGREGASSRAGR